MSPRVVLAVAAAGILWATSQSSAQEPPLLNSLEVQRLGEIGDSVSHARLHDHFAALTDKYATEARRYQSMSSAIIGNPNRSVPVRPDAHWVRLAARTTRSAAVVRELAAHHQRLASGLPSVAPPNSATYEGGRGAPAPTRSELRALAAAARLPRDHRILEEYYLLLAAKHDAVRDQHVAMAQAYRGNAGRRTGSGDPAVHCDRVIKQSRDAAADSRGRAHVHRQLATIG